MNFTIKRTKYCGEVRGTDVGAEVAVCGWVQRRRDLGGITFIDLRDRTGIIQLAFDESTAPKVRAVADAARSEFVLAARGVIRERSSKNSKIPTGDVELFVTALEQLSASETPPFEIVEGSKANEELRMKHRYLDLRRPDVMKNLIFRHKVAKITRDYFDENGFVEIETPILIKSTPEGARDYLVPSRIHKGSFYALPQSPQLYKQLSMVAGFDRYMQIARCFRDEDLRADRQPEFTQIDYEMSFVDVEDVLAIAEGYISRLFKEALDIEIPMPLPRLTFREAMERFGSDKPDLRYGMEIVNISETVKDSSFPVFADALAGGGSVRAINAKGLCDKLTRKEIDRLTEFVKGIGAKGLAWIRHGDQGVSSSFSKFMTEDEMNKILSAVGCEQGDAVLILADTNNSHVLDRLGKLRTEVSNRTGIEKNGFNFLWIVEMPFFELDEETGEYVAMHHPFTAPMDECIEMLDSDKANVRAKAYDLVLNGVELSSGSIRITDPKLQSKIFSLLGLTEEEAKMKFGYLLDAFRYGAPPHGGMGLGLDRLVMQMLGCESLRDVVAYPKMQNAAELMTSCPSEIPEKALSELGLSLNLDKK